MASIRRTFVYIYIFIYFSFFCSDYSGELTKNKFIFFCDLSTVSFFQFDVDSIVRNDSTVKKTKHTCDVLETVQLIPKTTRATTYWKQYN